MKKNIKRNDTVRQRERKKKTKMCKLFGQISTNNKMRREREREMEKIAIKIETQRRKDKRK